MTPVARGNFGCTAGPAELFLQSHDGAIDVLPSLPVAWPAGRVTGLRARGGLEITSLSWSAGQLSAATLRPKIGGILRVRSRLPLARPAGAALIAASGENPHPLFFTPPAPPPGSAPLRRGPTPSPRRKNSLTTS